MSFNVANVINTYNSKSGGPPRTVSLIAEAGAGHWRSTLFTTDYRESDADSLLLDEFPGDVCLLRSGALRALSGLRMMAGLDGTAESQLLRGQPPHLLHIHGIWSPLLASFASAAFRNGIPYVVAPHGMLEPWSLTANPVRKKWALKAYQHRVLANAAAIHATSEMEAHNIRRLRFGCAPVYIVPNAVVPAPQRGPRLQRAVSDERVLLFLSRLHEKKGVDTLLQAWNELRPAGWRLRIVGSGEAEYAARLRDYCRDHALPRVEFIPHVEGEEREQVFDAASLFVLPTYSENFGNVVAEALIRGLPVITTTGTPWSGMVEHQCGWYIEPTLSALKRAITEASSLDVHSLMSMGERGRKFAADRFSLPAVRGALLDLYHAALRPTA